MLLMGFLNRYADRHRLIPTGGVRYPNSRFERKMIPSCTGWIPKPSATGVNIGTRMMMAANTSMNESRYHLALCVGNRRLGCDFALQGSRYRTLDRDGCRPIQMGNDGGRWVSDESGIPGRAGKASARELVGQESTGRHCD